MASKEQSKTKEIRIRCSQREQEKFESDAKVMDLSCSDYLRALLSIGEFTLVEDEENLTPEEIKTQMRANLWVFIRLKKKHPSVIAMNKIYEELKKK